MIDKPPKLENKEDFNTTALEQLKLTGRLETILNSIEPLKDVAIYYAYLVECRNGRITAKDHLNSLKNPSDPRNPIAKEAERFLNDWLKTDQKLN